MVSCFECESQNLQEECLAIVPYTGSGGYKQQRKKKKRKQCWAIVPYAFDARPIGEGIPFGAKKGKSKRGRPRLDPNLRPNWLPEGWTVDKVPRTTGKTDSYYYSPKKKNKFRSRKEVVEFLETGKKRIPKRRRPNPRPEVIGVAEMVVEGGNNGPVVGNVDGGVGEGFATPAM